MKDTSFFLLLNALFALSVNALHLLSPRDGNPAVVKLGIQRKEVRDPVKRDALRKRQTVSQTLDNEVCIPDSSPFSTKLMWAISEHYTTPIFLSAPIPKM